jgi:3-hydroxyacyl-CoA dehydrogenase
MTQTTRSRPTTSSSATSWPIVLSGGDVAADTFVSEARFHELEQEAFLSLCGEQKTLERIQYMLTNNKPLRN